jgi:hypothetical protein
MSDQDTAPDDANEADRLEQHTFADGTYEGDEGDEAVPDVGDDREADPADVQEQETPIPIDDEREPR